MNIIPLSSNYEDSMWILNEIMRRSIDGTIIPVFVDYANNRVIIGGSSSVGSNAPLQVQSGDIEITTAAKGIIMKDDGGSGHTARLTLRYDPGSQNWVTNISTVS